LDAHSEYTTSGDDGAAQHRINQYLVKQEIGRGSFGAVHLAVDQYGREYVSCTPITHYQPFYHTLHTVRQSNSQTVKQLNSQTVK
jgi:hypothetical protein